MTDVELNRLGIRGVQECTQHHSWKTGPAPNEPDLPDRSSRFMALFRFLRASRNGQGHDQYHSIRHTGRQRTQTPQKDLRVFWAWKWEIVSIFCAIGLLAAIYVISQHYENQRIPDWGPAINLNTLIAALATVLRILLLYVIAEIIGQANWSHFTDKGRRTRSGPARRLSQINRFDQASRGLVGAVRLIPSIIKNVDTLLAVLVMIFASGIGAFVQQAIQTRPCQFPLEGVSSTLPVSRNVTSSATARTPDFAKFQSALLSALAPDNERIGSPISVDCLTGNCTFLNSLDGIYSTLGICSSCADISTLVSSTSWTQEYQNPILNTTYSVPAMNYSLPNGMRIEASNESLKSAWLLVNDQGDLDWAGSLIGPEMRALSQWSFGNITIFTSDWRRRTYMSPKHAAVSCTLYLCLRSYKASVNGGKLNESLVSAIPVTPNVIGVFPQNYTIKDIENTDFEKLADSVFSGHPGAPFQSVQSPCLVNGKTWDTTNMAYSKTGGKTLLLLHANPNGNRGVVIEKIAAPPKCIYNMDGLWWHSLQVILTTGRFFNGTCLVAAAGDPSITSINCEDQFWLAKFTSDAGATAASIMNRVEAFGNRLSNKIRMGLLDDNPGSVLGQVLETTVCTTIYYKWLLFPTILVAVTSGLLLWSLVQSWKNQDHELLWKSSILPLLFYGDRFITKNYGDVETNGESRLGAEDKMLLGLKEMEIEAKRRMVRFCRTN
ncbi:hypothetical protein NUW58_g3785 [Xylaria curta]|uniref:Uncharacterized protein n=1 Tax=Xylaria curta TaxID=42375 RepID=A0ACC1PAK0_9PEZI|nr:hypothetical protein NUW58_g3785 [Xylaria curta]